jgi:hypothetical protein
MTAAPGASGREVEHRSGQCASRDNLAGRRRPNASARRSGELRRAVTRLVAGGVGTQVHVGVHLVRPAGDPGSRGPRPRPRARLRAEAEGDHGNRYRLRGSLVLYASLCAAIGQGHVVGVDVEIRPHNRAALEARSSPGSPWSRATRWLRRSSNGCERSSSGPRALVVLDSATRRRTCWRS